MFRVNIRILELQSTFDLSQIASLMIKKDHWHYPLVEKINEPKLNVIHTFDLTDQESATSFSLELISKTDNNKAKMYGATTIDLLEWPMERSKRDKIYLSPQISLDLQLGYSYNAIQNSSYSFEEDFDDIQFEQQIMEAKSQNQYLKDSVSALQKQREELQKQSKELEKKRKELTISHEQLEKEIQNQKREHSKANREMEGKLERTNFSLASLVNLITEHADVRTIQALNKVLGNNMTRVGQQVLE